MNSIQLISKLKSKADDLNMALLQVTSGNHSLHTIEKEVLKKNCIELYELILKLKTEEEIHEEKPEIKPLIHAILAESEAPKPVEISPLPEEKTATPPVSSSKPIEPEPEPMPVKLPEFNFSMPDFEKTGSFTKAIEIVNQEEISLNNLEESFEEKIQDDEISKPITLFEIDENESKEPVIEEPIAPAAPVMQEVIEKKSEIKPPLETASIESVIPGYQPIEINIEKVVENKRILKTVMPDIEPVKPRGGLNDLLAGKVGVTRNDNLASTVQATTNNPFSELPIDNIKSEINLNRKIAFVNDLFAENVVDYAKAIDRMNNASSLQEAMLVFGEYKNQYNWKSDNELVVDLERLIRRRHKA
ncbi:MAG: hypothetical protein L6Q78_00250 [Bacteroidia bacterium]|nr:hypothetical protein [Bacteroidia bacterium]